MIETPFARVSFEHRHVCEVSPRANAPLPSWTSVYRIELIARERRLWKIYNKQLHLFLKTYAVTDRYWPPRQGCAIATVRILQKQIQRSRDIMIPRAEKIDDFSRADINDPRLDRAGACGDR
jgi:hypothetical protein